MQVQQTKNQPRPSRSGFTLVEVLMVVAIIGILAGLIIPAVGMALRAAQARAISMEVVTLADAVEKYRNKFDDYPPDGSNPTVMARHLRKIFPNIATTELSIFGMTYGGTRVANASNGAPSGVMDPAEALVFFLGGFSDDPAYPITGVGGPLFLTDMSGAQVNSSAASIATVQYNVDRVNGFYDFKQAQLTLGASTTTTISSDESELFNGSNDAIPAYRPSGKTAPYVYFCASTYTSGAFFNFYAPTDKGYARPYRSDKENTKVANTPAMANTRFPFMNSDKFQIISAGLDDSYGGIAMPSGAGGPTYFRFPSGDSIDFSGYPSSAPTIGGYTRYSDGPGVPSMQLDNSTNFANGKLEDSIPN
jgi:prepilin-type N-terminal cleavage/methylation domain-containing protein